MSSQTADIAIIGAGILGLAHALEAARRGKRVVVFEKQQQAQGASVRNFGFFFPLGMAPGQIYDRALRSREVWLEMAEAGFWHEPHGALIVANAPDEWAVLQEFYEKSHTFDYQCQLLDAAEALKCSPFLQKDHLQGALFDPLAICVDPRDAISKIPNLLQKRYGAKFRFGQTVNQITPPEVHTSHEVWQAERIIVCPGADLHTLYADAYAHSGIQLCKLQMMRTAPQPDLQRIGPMLAFGLTLQHYDSFGITDSLTPLKARFAAEHADYLDRGIHVMATQHGDGTVVLGDSHDYGAEVGPFDDMTTDRKVLEYLKKRLVLPDADIATRWHGIYAKERNGGLFVHEPEPGVTIVNGIGGIGMTTSFGVAQEVIEKLF